MISFSCDTCHAPLTPVDNLDQPWIVHAFGKRLEVERFDYLADKIALGHIACSLKCMTVAVNKWIEDRKLLLAERLALAAGATVRQELKEPAETSR